MPRPAVWLPVCICGGADTEPVSGGRGGRPQGHPGGRQGLGQGGDVSEASRAPRAPGRALTQGRTGAARLRGTAGTVTRYRENRPAWEHGGSRGDPENTGWPTVL